MSTKKPSTILFEEASAIMSRWYLHVEFENIGKYHDISLGECTEYTFIQPLLKVIKEKLDQNPQLIKAAETTTPTPMSILKQARLKHVSPLPDYQGTTCESQGKPTLLLCVRRQNITMANALWKSGAFNLIIEGDMQNLAFLLQSAGIIYQSFNDFLTPSVKSAVENHFHKNYPLWKKMLESHAFQQQFTLFGESYFDEIKASLLNVFEQQFPVPMHYIEAIKQLSQQKNIALIGLWNDDVPQYRALALMGQKIGIPVLHIAHGVYALRPEVETIYADRVAVIDFSNFYQLYKRTSGCFAL